MFWTDFEVHLMSFNMNLKIFTCIKTYVIKYLIENWKNEGYMKAFDGI